MHASQSEPQKTLLLIVNPRAGKRVGRGFERKLLGQWNAHGLQVTVVRTSRRGQAAELAAQLAGQYDRVACVGGDGTLHEVVCGLMRLPNPPPLGYIPAGTFNDVAHSLGLPTKAVAAGRVVVRDTARALDVGSFEVGSRKDTFFAYIACFGLFTDIPYLTSQRKKQLIGRLAYFWDGTFRLRHVPSQRVRIEHDGGAIEEELILCAVSNTRRFAGGIVRFDDPALDDGLFELLLVKKPRGFWALARLFWQVIHQRFDPALVTLLRTSFVRVCSEQPIQWTLDGENGGLHREATVRNLRQGLRIIL